jgi:hypothetical protein
MMSDRLVVRVLVKRRGKTGESWTEWKEGEDLWDIGRPLGLQFLESERVTKIEVKRVEGKKPPEFLGCRQ